MKMEKEITVKVNCNYEKLHNDLLRQNFKIVEEYTLNDLYFVKDNVDIFSMNILEILKQCILIRDVVGITKKIMYKYKKYDENENIVEQGKTECEIVDVGDAVELIKKLNYNELIKIFDKCIVYTDGKIEITVQLVNDKYIFIEMDDQAEHISTNFTNIEEMIKSFEVYDIDYDKNDYFVKKARIVFLETH